VLPLVRTSAISAALPMKLAASVSVTAVIPPTAAMTPPSPDPASRAISPTCPLSALAVSGCSSGTSRGTIACWAGPKNCAMTPSVNITKKTIQTGPALCTSSSGTSPAACSRLAVIIIRLRFQRSANTPATAPSSTCGAAADAIVSAEATAEPVMV
jgi:hypothetical protein